jgi:hypothetical protein
VGEPDSSTIYCGQTTFAQESIAMTLRELLKQDFDIDFPISGGFGNSREQPVIIHQETPNDYTSVEYGILRCLGIGRGIEWKLKQQATIKHEGKTLDQMKIETIQTTEKEVITQIENYYFDITECVSF